MERRFALRALLGMAAGGFASLGWGQRRRQAAPPAAPPPEPDEEEHGEEPQYTFNPIQAKKEMQVGDYYFKKGSFRAAAGRYDTATKWQPNLAEAFYKLGEAREKLEQRDGALAAYQQYLDLSPPAGRAAEVRKKIAKLQSEMPKPGAGPAPPRASKPSS